MKTQFEPYNRPRIFKHAWDWARHTATLVPVPVNELFPHAMKVAWSYERKRREAILLTQAMDRFDATITAIEARVAQMDAQMNALKNA